MLLFLILKFLLLTALRMSFSLQLQKEALLKLNHNLDYPCYLSFPYNCIQRAGGGGVLGYVPTPLGRKSGKRERRKSSVSHVDSSTEW